VSGREKREVCRCVKEARPRQGRVRQHVLWVLVAHMHLQLHSYRLDSDPPKLTLCGCCGPACVLLPARHAGVLLLVVVHRACDQHCGRETRTEQAGKHAGSFSRCPRVEHAGCGGPMWPRAAPIAVAAPAAAAVVGQRCCSRLLSGCCVCSSRESANMHRNSVQPRVLTTAATAHSKKAITPVAGRPAMGRGAAAPARTAGVLATRPTDALRLLLVLRQRVWLARDIFEAEKR
jgi:hypothetical protein